MSGHFWAQIVLNFCVKLDKFYSSKCELIPIRCSIQQYHKESTVMCGVQVGQLMPPDRGPTNQSAPRSPGSASDSLNLLLYGKCETITPSKLGKSVPR